MDKLKIIISALENSQFKWRTLVGISQETGIPVSEVEGIMSANGNLIVKSSTRSIHGEELYTSRERFKKTASPLTKIFGALKNRVD